MAFRRPNGPNDPIWETLRPTITRLYATENRTRKAVSRIMKSDYGFIASKNQYTPMFKKWGLKKKTKKTMWKAIAPHVLAMERLGEQATVVIDGQMKSHKTVQRETRRYASGENVDINTATLPPLPAGVIVRPAASRRLPFVMPELPFQCFERHIRNTLLLNLQGNCSQGTSQTRISTFTDCTSTSEHRDVHQALQAVISYDTPHAEPSSTSSKNRIVQMFASQAHRSVICSIANNFAGMETLPIEKVFEYLRSHTTNEMLQLILSTQNLYITQALTLNLFNAAIEVGDDRVLDLILATPQSRMQTNKTYPVDGVLYTPLQRAAELGHDAAIRVLLKYGADATVTMAGHTSESERSGVLDLLVEASTWPKEIDPVLFRLLLSSGAKPNESTVESLCYESDPVQELIPITARQRGPQIWSDWNKSGITLLMFELLESTTLDQILGLMIENKVDLNFNLQCANSTNKPVTIIDAVALRGDRAMATKICEAGANPTADTLSFAINSGREDMILYALTHPRRIHSTRCGRLSPLGAAIRNANEKILSLISSDKSLMDIEKRLEFQSALVEAARIGNLAWVDHILKVQSNIDSRNLGEALAQAVVRKHRDIALILLSAGADANIGIPGGRYLPPRVVFPLQIALEHGDHTLVHKLLGADADPNYDTWDDGDDQDCVDPAIVLAAKSGDEQLIQMVINAGGNVNPNRERFRSCPLAVAAANNNKEIFDFLVGQGCNINRGGFPANDQTVLCSAVETHDIDMVTYVLDRGADPHDVWALCEASQIFDKAFQLILERHHKRYPKGRPWGADVLWAAISANDYGLFQKMLSFGGNPSHYTKLSIGYSRARRSIELAYMTPFGLSIAISDEIGPRYAEHLLLNKVKWNCRSETIVADTTSHRRTNPVSQSTAFLVAIETGYRPVIDLLLREGADVNFPTELGVKRTPLQKAAEMCNLEIIQLLLNRGADINAPAAKRGGGTALQLAAAKGSSAVVKMLLANGAEVNADASDVNGMTALECAAEQGRVDILNLLLSAIAATGKTNVDHFARARALVKKNGRHYMVDALDAFIRDGTISCHSMAPTQYSDGLDTAAAQISSYCENTDWTGSDDEGSSISNADGDLYAGSGSPEFDAFLNFDAMET